MPNPTADPYLPDHGDPRFHVEHYDLDIAYKPFSNHLQGRARLQVHALEDLGRLTLDLYALQVTKVNVSAGGRRVPLDRWQHRGSRLSLKLKSEVARGQELTVEVHYRGQPRTMPGPDGRAGWEELTDGAIVASQPHGSPSWFPCNDRSDDKARYDIAITTAGEYAVIANGSLVGERRHGGGVTRHFQMAEPMAPYLATVAIGRFVVSDLPTPPGLRVPVRLACPPAFAERARQAFADQGAMVAYFTQLLGDYPFTGGYTAVVTADALEIPLESQGLSTFGSNLLSRDWDAQRLIAHELSHQWFGNCVTAGTLGDIWLHEGFACYSEWLWSQQCGLRSTDEWARHHWRSLQRKPQDLEIGRPGARRMFDDRVYKRGALTLHVLRLTVGDDAFFTILRQWVIRHRYGVVETADFVVLAEEVTGIALAAHFEAWLYAAGLPPLPR